MRGLRERVYEKESSGRGFCQGFPYGVHVGGFRTGFTSAVSVREYRQEDPSGVFDKGFRQEQILLSEFSLLVSAWMDWIYAASTAHKLS